MLLALPSLHSTISQDLASAMRDTTGLKTVALSVETIKDGICRPIHASVLMDMKELVTPACKNVPKMPEG